MIICVFIMAYIAFADNLTKSSTKRILRHQKPVMYTFYDKIDSKDKHTGMTNDADQRLLKVWEEEWNAAGWDTRILNLEDAKKHPRFSEFHKKLEPIHLKTLNVVYNRLCYYRWLAMSSVGGGWMSDYDVLPMNFDATIDDPSKHFKDGSFSIYATTGDGGIPCLMSGSESEWDRMAFSIVEDGDKHEYEAFWSDMVSTFPTCAFGIVCAAITFSILMHL